MWYWRHSGLVARLGFTCRNFFPRHGDARYGLLDFSCNESLVPVVSLFLAETYNSYSDIIVSLGEEIVAVRTYQTSSFTSVR